jgi:hypothetical protein
MVPATLQANSLCRVQEKRTKRQEELRAWSLNDRVSRVPSDRTRVVVCFLNYLQRAYNGLLLPLLGFLFLPLTALAYAWLRNTRQPIAGLNLLLLIIAVVIDLASLSGDEYHRRTRWED